MRSPASIHDRTILEDDPLKSMFLGRLMQGRGSRRSDEAKITNNIADEVEATEGGPFAVETWLVQVFGPASKPSRQGTVFFVEFFWRLAQNLTLEANELLKSQHVKYLANPRLDGSRGKTFQRKLNGQQFDAQPTARSSSDWDAKPADEVIERPRKIQRLEGAPSSPETATSLKIRIPALSQRLDYRRVTRGRPRKNRGIEPAVSRESIATTSAQATCKSNSIASTDVPFTFPHSPLAFPPPTEGKILPLTWIPQAALVIQLKHEDQEMVYYDPVPVAVQYSWPSQTGFPPVWSQSRQEMCKTLPWFRSFHGGVYQKSGVAKGYMLSEFGCERDCFLHGGRLIISHGGGGRPENESGRIDEHVADQKANAWVRALFNNCDDGTPLVLLVDDKYAQFPLNLKEKDIYLAVLGFYTIVEAWAESHLINGANVVRYKFVFQWCADQGEPWWTAEPNEFTAPASINVNRLYMCSTCGERSPHVFVQGQVCLKPQCSKFWVAPYGRLSGRLDYMPHLLSLREPPKFPDGFDSRLVPERRIPSADEFTTSFLHSRGWHCQKCGRVSSRFAWEKYVCLHCQDEHDIIGKVHTAASLQGTDNIKRALKQRAFIIAAGSGIAELAPTKYFHSTGSAFCQSFTLPNNKGTIHHIRGSDTVNGEANRLLEEYQIQASAGTLLFRRWPLKRHAVRGAFRSSYFSQNSGETYQYIGGSNQTVTFNNAPGAVVDALRLIQTRLQAALGRPYQFNELLSVAYLEKQLMAYHSDNEQGLGPVVAGLSLGSPAVMNFRTAVKPQNGQHRAELTLLLQHGDILVMEGAGVQDYYEHTVEPENFRIAVTARHIAPQANTSAKKRRRAIGGQDHGDRKEEGSNRRGLGERCDGSA
ncbi:hypothetical protein B0H13DRAFT_1956449 [Mycena leptocephala]|nr:hypothetical protein B0H13DRAFT_1956449 [Mycena leptocephala]